MALAPPAGLHRLFLREIRAPELPPFHAQLRSRAAEVTLPGRMLVATVATFEDEIYAYLNFEYLRTRTQVYPAEVLLTYRSAPETSDYPILFHVNNDLTKTIPFLEALRNQGFIPGYDWRFITFRELNRYRQQSRVFTGAYNWPVHQRFERLTQAQKQDLIRRFVIFKSRTDPRVRRGILPVPRALSEEEASRLVADVITVADFFDLPLDFFLGIAAMENNYMSVPGDLENAVWKRRAEKGDLVLRRQRGRVLVLNYASGVWQITRETLRYAHRLYAKDDRDYSQLPEHLRLPDKLNLDEIQPAQLTTYAGLLFRHFLDRFDGDVAKAVGAYNGGPGSPNMQYEAGVRVVANYARRIVEQAARLNGQAVAEMSFLARGR